MKKKKFIFQSASCTSFRLCLYNKYTDSVSEQRMSVYNRFGVYDFCQCRV